MGVELIVGSVGILSPGAPPSHRSLLLRAGRSSQVVWISVAFFTRRGLGRLEVEEDEVEE